VNDEDLRRLYVQLAEEVRGRWDRDLPLEELLSDRWERARRLGFGEGASIYASSYVYGPVMVGPRTWIGPFTLLDGSGGLEIGGNCSISAGVQIYTHDTVNWALTDGAREPERSPVRIGDCCFIGSMSVVARGVAIGDHCVLGAHSYLDRDLGPFTFAAGCPARPLGRVEIDGTDVRIVRD
jgi:acetyltransferase-like isoleucine patch superfamily enzyme